MNSFSAAIGKLCLWMRMQWDLVLIFSLDTLLSCVHFSKFDEGIWLVNECYFTERFMIWSHCMGSHFQWSCTAYWSVASPFTTFSNAMPYDPFLLNGFLLLCQFQLTRRCSSGSVTSWSLVTTPRLVLNRINCAVPPGRCDFAVKCFGLFDIVAVSQISS